MKNDKYKSCTNCYGDLGEWSPHIKYKGYYWCDGCDYKKLYKLFIKKGLIQKLV
jgi:hypothetical protein